MSRDERVQIEALWAAGLTVTAIAGVLSRPVCTISREIKRNGGHDTGCAAMNPRRERGGRSVIPRRRWIYLRSYNARTASRRARSRVVLTARAPKLAEPALSRLVASKLVARWSPQQVAGWLRTEHGDRADWQVSHETIYQALFCQARGQLRVELARQIALAQEQDRLQAGPGDHRQVLRSGRVNRRPKARQVAPGVRSRRAVKPWTAGWNISERPADAQDRAVPGHWEGDLVIGTGGHSAMITLVERSTRYVMLGALPQGRDSAAVIEVLTALIERLPEHLRRSLTWDNGVEMARVADFRVATGCPVYFADPHHPWQRGSNENTNGLLRQYFPKSRHDFTTTSQQRLDQVADDLNTRPRQTLGWDHPARRLAAVLALEP